MLVCRPRSFRVTTRLRSLQPRTAYVRRLTAETPLDIHDLIDPLDEHIVQSIRKLLPGHPVSVSTLHEQYRARSGWIRDDLVLVSEERPAANRRVEFERPDHISVEEAEEHGDGTVLIVHALLKPTRSTPNRHGLPQDKKDSEDIVEKLAVCSGFVLNTRAVSCSTAKDEETPDDGAVVLTCAHTLEEMHRYLARSSDDPATSLSFILTSKGTPIAIKEVISSIPRSDLCVFRTESPRQPLRSLPISLYPIPIGQPVAVHLFGSILDAEGPKIRLNRRFRKSEVDEALQDDHAAKEGIQSVRSWIGGKALRRWAIGMNLGYRSYTGQEVEAGSTHTLPHLQTSALPTPGSSGGAIVRLDTGTVVGLTSGTRMDNRVEGERGWGATAEGVFEMFALPGFVPASRRK